MPAPEAARNTDDPFELSRFLTAQEFVYAHALAEIKAGQKSTHWMWYIFPQIDGLAFSSTAKHYAIKSLEEAQAYLDHPVLGSRLRECAEAAITVEGRSVAEIFGSPDDLKLKSSATLFASLSQPGSVFHQLLKKYYQGKQDERTLGILKNHSEKATD